jgi:CheY-like chemotaxis protein
MAKILLVDDDELVRRVTRHFLERGGHTVTEATDGLTALAALDADSPDLVLTDIIMPGMNGLELILEVHRRQPVLPIVAVSGGAPSNRPAGVLLVARDLGAAATFPKPLDMPALLTAVDSLSRRASRA